MPSIVTRFTNSRSAIDKQNQRLKPKAFIPSNTSEISVVCIDDELNLDNFDEVIFNIGSRIYPREPFVKARGDMDVVDIEQIKYGEGNLFSIYLEPCPTEDIQNHYNIKPVLEDLEFANRCAYNLSRISRLVMKI